MNLKRIQQKAVHAAYRLGNIPYYFFSLRKDADLAKRDVVCVMCVWDEQFMAPLAIESSKDFVSRYIIVDKNGKTLPVIYDHIEGLELEIDGYVKPLLSLREARMFAVDKIDEPWILIQDGDEVFHTDGPNSIHGLRYYMDRSNVYFCTRMAILYHDLRHTKQRNPIQPPHKFLYHNNGTMRFGRGNDDIPDSKAWHVTLPGVWKFNCLVKHPKRHYLRSFWRQWCRDSDAYRKYPDLEEYVNDELGIDVEAEYLAWYENKIKDLVIYDEEKLGYYPEVIRKQLA